MKERFISYYLEKFNANLKINGLNFIEMIDCNESFGQIRFQDKGVIYQLYWDKKRDKLFISMKEPDMLEWKISDLKEYKGDVQQFIDMYLKEKNKSNDEIIKTPGRPKGSVDTTKRKPKRKPYNKKKTAVRK